MHPPRFANRAVIGWIGAILLAAILILVKWDAIARGPTSEEAITAIGTVERHLAEARALHANTHPEQLSEAHRNLKQAWDSLSRKDYQQAIDTAHAAEELLAKLPKRN